MKASVRRASSLQCVGYEPGPPACMGSRPRHSTSKPLWCTVVVCQDRALQLMRLAIPFRSPFLASMQIIPLWYSPPPSLVSLPPPSSPPACSDRCLPDLRKGARCDVHHHGCPSFILTALRAVSRRSHGLNQLNLFPLVHHNFDNLTLTKM